MVSATSESTSKRPALGWLAAAGLSAAAVFAANKLLDTIRASHFDMRGKIVLITGSRGLGLAIAHELGGRGARLALTARDAAELDRACAQLGEAGIEATSFPADLLGEGEINGLIERIVAHYGRIDVLVNNAGEIQVGPFEVFAKQDYEHAMNLMFWAPVNLTLAVLPHFRKQGGGHVVNITSIGGRVSVPHLLPYSAAKFAFVGFSTGLSAEAKQSGVHVLTVVPGLMRTGSYLNAQFAGDAKHEFAWFSALGNSPAFSVSADYAARQIRRALEAQRYTCTISLPAKILIASEALAPEITRTLMALTSSYLLPKAEGGGSLSPGKNFTSEFGPWFHALTTLGRSAAQAWNESARTPR